LEYGDHAEDSEGIRRWDEGDIRVGPEVEGRERLGMAAEVIERCSGSV
jgi:hypothetical protein